VQSGKPLPKTLRVSRWPRLVEDISIPTAGQLISEELGIKLENVTLQMLGRAKRVHIEKKSTTIIAERRSFDEMPSPISLARQGSRCSGVSVKRQDGFAISPRSGLSGQPRRQLAIIRLGVSLMSVVPSIIVLVITALLVFRRELTTRPAAPASKPTPGAKRRPLRQSKPRLRPPA
jgi:hypothetical protein